MNTQAQEALNNAIELIEIHEDKLDSVLAAKVLKSCMEALAQPAQEPVAWMHSKERLKIVASPNHQKNGYTIPLYTHPAPAREPLSNERLDEIVFNCGLSATAKDIVRAIEQALKEKNHG